MKQIKKVFFLLLIGILSISVFLARPNSVTAVSDTIYIRANGNIDPPTSLIIYEGFGVYRLTGNISFGAYNGIVIERNNTILDGAGFTIEGSGSANGITVDIDRTNITVKNLNIRNFGIGMTFERATYCVIQNNTISNVIQGIVLWHVSKYCTVLNNNVTDCSFEAIELWYSPNNNVTGNAIANCGTGVLVEGSPGSVVFGQNISNATRGGVYLSSDNVNVTHNTFINCGLTIFDVYRDNIVLDNIVNEKPLVYLYGDSDQTITNAGQVILISCSQITVQGLDLAFSSMSVALINTNNSLVSHCRLDGGRIGVYMSESYGNSVTENKVQFNAEGVALRSSSNNTISGNNVTDNDNTGIYIEIDGEFNKVTGNIVLRNNGWGIEVLGDYNIVSGNVFSGNSEGGIDLRGSDCTVAQNTVTGNGAYKNGIDIEDSDDNYVFANNVSYQWYGVYVDNSDWNTFEANSLSNNYCAFSFSNSRYNSVYHNNFINNSQEYDLWNSPTFMDDGYPSGGNYYSGYDYPDDFRGEYQNETGSDGIMDYSISWDSETDYYPLKGPFNTFYAATLNQEDYYFDIVSNSTVTGYTFNPTNKTLSFTATGETDTSGFCRVTLPLAIMWCNTSNQWSIKINNQPVNYSLTEDYYCTYLYFNYTHSTKFIQIESIYAIPEFTATATLLLFVLPMLLAASLNFKKKKESDALSISRDS